MAYSVTVLLLAATAAVAQTVSLSPMDCSISGTVTNAATGVPLPKRTVSVTMAGGAQRSVPITGRGAAFGAGFAPRDTTAETDFVGHYKVSHVLPGDYVVSVKGDDLISASANVTVPDGKDVTGVDFAVQVSSSISGTVMDRDKRPILSANVFLMQKLYRNGKTGYGQVSMTVADLQGRYKLDRGVPAGGSYIVLAKIPIRSTPAISDEPEDPEKRLPAVMPTYSLNSHFPEAALTITPSAGQKLEGVDIQVERVKAYCVEGVTQAESAPAAMSVEIFESDMWTGEAATTATGVFMVSRRQNGTGAAGKFRICGLHPGEYRLLATAPPRLSAVLPLSIADRDIDKLQINVLPPVSLPGEVVWDKETSPSVVDAHVRVSITPLQRGAGQASVSAPLPGRFVADGLGLDEYAVRAYPPAGVYVKDVTYGGISILNQTFQMGSAIGDGGLKVIVGTDGGTVSAKVADSDGNPVPKANVWFLPSSAKTAAELETVLVSGTTDRDGLCTSATLRPGKYLVFATIERFDHSAAHIDKLWGARLKGAEVDLGPKASAQVSLSPISVF